MWHCWHMDREIITFESEEEWLDLRSRDLTSTSVSAILGVSPYSKRADIVREKKQGGRREGFVSEAMQWGNLLEPAIAEEAGRRLGVSPVAFKIYARIPSLRLGSSFDYRTDGAIIECKNVSRKVYDKSWTAKSAPLHIETQVQHQMLVLGVNKCYIAALVGGNKMVILEREPNEKITSQIRSEAKRFWDEVEGGDDE